MVDQVFFGFYNVARQQGLGGQVHQRGKNRGFFRGILEIDFHQFGTADNKEEKYTAAELQRGENKEDCSQTAADIFV